MPRTIFSEQDYMDFALTDSVLHFNDGEKGNADIFSQLGLMLYPFSHLLWGERHPQDMYRAKKHEKAKKNIILSEREQRKDQGDNYYLVEGSVCLSVCL